MKQHDREIEKLEEEKRGDGRLGEGRQAHRRVARKNGVVSWDLRGGISEGGGISFSPTLTRPHWPNHLPFNVFFFFFSG